MRGFAARTLLVATSVLALLAPAASTSVAQPRCAPTRPDMLGPFYTPNAPERARTGQGLVVNGRVVSSPACSSLAGARVEWWSANARGDYDDAHRATQIADGEGRYRYETDFPGRYEPRPVHLHVRVSAPGHRTLVTQLYPNAGQTSVATDFVLVRE